MTHTPDFLEVARLDDIPDQGILGVEGPGGVRICLVRLGDQVSALADECTHQAFPLSAGEVHADGTLECTWHGARFDCATGAVRREPALEPVPVYPVRVDGDRILVGRKEESR